MNLFKRRIVKASIVLGLSVMLTTPVMAATTLEMYITVDDDHFGYTFHETGLKVLIPNFLEKTTLLIDPNEDEPGEEYYEKDRIFDFDFLVIKKSPEDPMFKISLDAKTFSNAAYAEFVGEDYLYYKGKNLRMNSNMHDIATIPLTTNGSQKELIFPSSLLYSDSKSDGVVTSMNLTLYDENGKSTHYAYGLDFLVLNEMGTETLTGRAPLAPVAPIAPLVPVTPQPGKSIGIEINGNLIPSNISPLQENGSTFVPVRVVSEYLGAAVSYNGKIKEVTIVKEDQIIKLKIDSKKASTNGISSDLTAAPRLIKGTTFVPIRMIAEAFNSNVDWIKETQTVIISEK